MKGVEKLRLAQSAAGAVLAVKAVPGASRSRIAGVLGDALKVTVAAAAEKGKANAALAALLAETFGLSARDVRLTAGATSPRKEFLLAGLSVEDVRRRLADV